jgi:hypothetical protein
MRKLLKGLLWLSTGFPLLAQARTVTLTWTDPINPVGTVYNVYKASGPCAPSAGTVPNGVKIATGITPKTFNDLNVALGTYCYQVTAGGSPNESDPTQANLVNLKLFGVTGLSITIQ